jgi:hypothetical protein
MKCACKTRKQHILEHIPWKIKTFGIWFLIKTHFQIYYWNKLRNYIIIFFRKFKKKTWHDSGYCFTGTNGTPTTIY